MVSAETEPPTSCPGNPLSPLTILHFNDVYNVEEQACEPKGGAARFKTAIKSSAEDDPLVLFSGDFLAPSIMSTFTKGEQMIPVLNQLGIHCAVYGNHDFDFGVDRLVEVTEQTNFPWLMSNVEDNDTERPLAEGLVTVILEWRGWKIGLMGLVEQEWLDTLSTIDPDDLAFMDFVDRGRELALELRSQGCDYVIALTHMRTPNDVRLAENVEEIDLILGGHDHVYEIHMISGKHVIKSGTDFREFSKITLTRNGTQVLVDVRRVEVDSQFEPDSELQNSLASYEEIVNHKMGEPLGSFSVELDGRFCVIRTSETNLGNFVCDIMLAACNADIAILNSGTFRSDRVHPMGKFKMRDLMTVLPMLDSLVVMEVIGATVIEVLENGVSQYPKLEGRFPQVAGIQFAFNPFAPAGSRILKDFVKVGDEYLDPNAKYRLVTKEYLRQGKDGYQMLTDCPVVQDSEQCPVISTAVINHFSAIDKRLGKVKRNSRHRQSLILLSRRHSFIRYDEDVFRPPPKQARPNRVMRSYSVDSAVGIEMSPRYHLSRMESFNELEMEACKLSPRIEGRILVATDEVTENLRKTKALSHLVSAISEEDEVGSTPSTPRSPPTDAHLP